MYTTAFSACYIQLQEYKCNLIVAGMKLVVVGSQFIQCMDKLVREPPFLRNKPWRKFQIKPQMN